MLDFCSKLTWLVAHEDFILFIWYEHASLKLSSLICTKYIFQLYTNKYFELKIIHINNRQYLYIKEGIYFRQTKKIKKLKKGKLILKILRK